MAGSGRGAVRELERLVRDGADPPGGDARLLHRYLVERDESAFVAIVDRHGPPVLALCRRFLRDPADVEDAFQATFLVLVRKGRGLRDADALSSWLYGVAYRVAVRARSDVLRRREREGDREGLHAAAASPGAEVDDAPRVLDEELSRLPEKYRAPLVLCYLKGKTHDQAAAELGWPVGTVRSRMAKARSILRDRLGRRGLDASACLAALRADLAAAPLVPSSLVAATAAAAGRFAGLSAGLGWLWSAAPPSSRCPAESLAQGVLTTMSTSPWKPIGFALACAGLTAGALAVASGTRDAPGPAEEPPRPQAAPVEKDGPLSPAKSAEDRLSEVERKLDRLIGLMEKADGAAPTPAAPSTLSPSSSVLGVGPAIGLTPPPTPAEARSLREIEAQLVSVYRKYEIVQEHLGRISRMSSQTHAKSLREDAVAPARILVARLREMEEKEARAEDQARLALKRAMMSGGGGDVEALRTRVEGELKKAEEALVKSGRRPEDVVAERLRDGRSTGSAYPDDPDEVRNYLQARTNHRQADERFRQHKAQISDVETIFAYQHSRAEAVRRLIAWAKDRFQDVELTIDQAAPAAK